MRGQRRLHLQATGQRRPLCSPPWVDDTGRPTYRWTSNPEEVTCKACMRTNEYKLLTDPNIFWDYFNVADEIWGGLSLDDLDKKAVHAARVAASRYGLSWPPSLPEAEEFSLNNNM